MNATDDKTYVGEEVVPPVTAGMAGFVEERNKHMRMAAFCTLIAFVFMLTAFFV